MISVKKVSILALGLTIMSLVSCSSKKESDESETDSTALVEDVVVPMNMAKAVIQSASGSTLTGEATFEKTDGGIKMVLSVQHTTPGEHAVHLHQSGDCSAPDATSAGDHWNPNEVEHGNRAGDGAFHSGDIANLVVAADSTGTLEIIAPDWTIGGDAHSDVIGKAVIIHASEDDFVSQPSGNAGARVGCGVVEMM